MSGKKAKEARALDELAWARREVVQVRALNDQLVEERDDLACEVERLKSHLQQTDFEQIKKDFSSQEARHGPEATWLCRLSRLVFQLNESCMEDGETGEAMLPMDEWEELTAYAREIEAAIHHEEAEP